MRPTAPMIVITMAVLSLGYLRASASQEQDRDKKTTKVWTEEDLKRTHSSDPGTPTGATLPQLQNPEVNEDNHGHYSRTKDPKWYVKQISSLREEAAQIEAQLRGLRESLKGGKGATSAMVLDQDTPGISPEAQIQVLQQRRSQLQRKIDDLEEEARKNDIGRGILRNTVVPDVPVVSNPTGRPDPKQTHTENALKNEREHLERVKAEINLMQRNLDLQTRQLYSNPDARARRSGESKLAALKQEIVRKQQEMENANEIMASLEDHLEDLKLNAGSKTSSDEDRVGQDKSRSAPRATDDEQLKKDERYWRKRFADAYYAIHMAEKELDVLQRELNLDSVQYYPDPNKTLREEYSRREINVRRQKIEDKKLEIKKLKEGLADLEDQLRHAGGDPGWSRE